MQKSSFTLIIILIVASLFSGSGYAQQGTDFKLHFKNNISEPVENTEAYIQSFSLSQEQVFDGHLYKIIQFNEIPSHLQREKLAEAGIELLDYIPHLGYFASLQTNFEANILNQTNARSIIEISSDMKLAPMLFEESYPDYALRGDGKIELLLSYFEGVNTELAIVALNEMGTGIAHLQAEGNFIQVIAKLDDIQDITKLAFVNYLEPIYPTPEPENYTGRTLHRSNAIANDFSTGRNYDGSDVSVMLQDDGKIGPHIDFEGRLIEQFLGYFGGDHGDHCAGIIGSAGNLDPTVRGNAFGANLYVYGAAPDYPGFSSISSHYFSKDIRVTSTSYSNGCNAGYTSLARSLDMQIINYPALMHVFSAGNDGGSNCGYGAGSGWGNITGGHKVGKNVMTVANLDFLDGLSGSSSRGPAQDGRIKPDISAKGSSVYSTLPDNEYGYKTGTSMSCPGVAGVMAQLFHAYRDLNGGSDPLGGLLKAVALNTAEDLGNHGPDFKFGWGRINALRAVQVLEEGRYDSANIDNGATMTHTFEVPENTAQMKVMVYWTDYQGSVNSNWALVNNLDITITDPASQDWMPWVLNHYPDADSLNKPAIRGMDDRNNMEQVSIESPEAGTYTLTVDGTTVPQGPQKYYIIYEYIPMDVILTYPFGGESFVPGMEEVIRWDAYGSDEDFSLEYSLDNGNNWEIIHESIDGDRRYYEWTPPSAMTSQAVVRITKGSSVSQVVEPFTIMPQPRNLSIDWACENAVHFSWTEVFGATDYTLFSLGEKYMEPIATTDIGSYILNDINSSETYWFAIAANGPDGAQSLRTVALEKSPGTFNCNETDAMMVAIPSVDWGVFQSCMDINALTITVEMKNFGLESITNPTFNYQLDEGNTVTESYSGTIEADSCLLFSFDEALELSEIGSYVLKAWIDYAPDQNPDNDLIATPLTIIEGTTFTTGNTQNLENFTNCIPAPICELNNCALGEGWFNLTNQENDDIDWLTWHGTTNTFHTGPSTDHTTGTTDGKYIYIEPSVICFDKLAILSTPCIDLNGAISPALDFWYHAYGADIGRLHVDIFDGSNVFLDICEPIVGNQGDAWHNLTVDLTPYSGKVIGIRFRGITGGKDQGDLALDDISITDVTSINNNISINGKLNLYPNPANDFVNVSLENAGTDSYNLSVLDIYGRMVFNANIMPVDGQIAQALDLSGLSKGVYFIRLKSALNSFNTKLTLQ